MFDVFLGDRVILVGGLAIDEVVGIAIEDLAAEIVVAQVREAALGKCLVARGYVAAGAHPVNKADARTKHRRTAEEIVVLTDRVSDRLHPEAEAFDTGDRGIKGLDAFDVLALFQDVVLESVAHEVHLEVGDTPVFLHGADALGDVGPRAGVRVVEEGVVHDSLGFRIRLDDHLAVLIVQEILGVLLADFRCGIATEAVEVQAGRLALCHDARDDGLDPAGKQIRTDGGIVTALGPPATVDLDHVSFGGELVERIHVAIDVLGGENPAVVVPRRPSVELDVLELGDAILRRDGGTEVIEHVEPVVAPLEDDLFVLNGVPRLELLTLAIGPDHQRLFLQGEVRQENAP